MLPDLSDRRVGAVVAVAPVGAVFGDEAFSGVEAPVQIHRLEGDRVLRRPWHADRIVKLMGKNARLVVHPSAHHFAYIWPFPAPVGARQLTGHLLYGVIYRCLAQFAPERVVAESGSTPSLRSVYGGVDRRGNRFNQVLFACGGLGASHRMDGYACTAFPSGLVILLYELTSCRGHARSAVPGSAGILPA